MWLLRLNGALNVWCTLTLAAVLVGTACAPTSTPAAPTAAPQKPAAEATTPAQASKPAATTVAGEATKLTAAAPSGAPAFRDVLEAAKREGVVELWAGPTLEERAAFEDAFNKRFGTSIKITGFDLTAGVAAARLVTEAQAGKPTADFLQPSYDIAFDLRQRDLMPDPYPWAEVFGQELPQIRQAVDHIKVPSMQGRVLGYRDIVYGGLYRTDMIGKQELPTEWEQLADPKFRGRFVLDVRGYPFNYLALQPGWDEARVVDLARRIKANGPAFERAAGQVSEAVKRGQAVFGFSSTGGGEECKLANLPCQEFFIEPVPMNPLLATVPKTSPHPNAARLFAAWVTTEGSQVLESKGLTMQGRIDQRHLNAIKSLYEQVPNPRVLNLSSEEQVAASNAILKKVGAVLAGTE